jgi:hypothetical protein
VKVNNLSSKHKPNLPMSPVYDTPNYDTLITSGNNKYFIREMPLNPLIALIHGITPPSPTKFNQDYEYKFVGIPDPFCKWSRRYKANWLLQNDKFFLTGLEGEIYGVKLTPHTFFFRHILATSSTFKELATWYTGVLTAYSEQNFAIIGETEVVVTKKVTHQIEKGIVISNRLKLVYVIFSIFVAWDELILQYLVNRLN